MRLAMIESNAVAAAGSHSHVFLGEGHEKSERKTWAVIWLCGAMMIAEIVGGLLFGSIALVADGLHMSTHAGALLLAALAYTYARKHVENPIFTFGTGKFGDLAGFTSAIILAMIALLIGYESVSRLFDPIPIHFREAIPIAFVGLAVNIASAWLLSGGDHHHGHVHGHGHEGHDHDESRYITTGDGTRRLEVFEDGVPPRFRLHVETGPSLAAQAVSIETVRPDGTRQRFAMDGRDGYLESVRRLHEGLQSFLSMRRMEARWRKARALWLRFSQSLASRRHRPSQPMVRSTIQRMGSTTKPLAWSERLTISITRLGMALAMPSWKIGPL